VGWIDSGLAAHIQPRTPTQGTRVRAGPHWLHEIKHNGYRLIVWRGLL
jgi:ATP-dependent DNA ligase